LSETGGSAGQRSARKPRDSCVRAPRRFPRSTAPPLPALGAPPQPNQLTTIERAAGLRTAYCTLPARGACLHGTRVRKTGVRDTRVV